jgi:hypothetical protein
MTLCRPDVVSFLFRVYVGKKMTQSLSFFHTKITDIVTADTKSGCQTMGQFGLSSVNPRFGTKNSKHHKPTQNFFGQKQKICVQQY